VKIYIVAMSKSSTNQIETDITQELNNIKASVLAINLSNPTTKEKIEEVTNTFTKQIESSGDKIIKLIPFHKGTNKIYKDGTPIPPAGYVIETEKGILLAYHGTQPEQWRGSGAKELLHDAQIYKATMEFGGKKCGVHAGFKKEYHASKLQLQEALSQVNLKKPLIICGHSLGASVALIAALDIETNGIEIPVRDDNSKMALDTKINSPQLHSPQKIKIDAIITFGAPRGLYKSAAKKFNETSLQKKTLRIENPWDPITKVPPKSLFPVQHVGTQYKFPSQYWDKHCGDTYRSIAAKLTLEDLEQKKQTLEDLEQKKQKIANIKNSQENSISGYTRVITSLSTRAWKTIKRSINIRQILKKTFGAKQHSTAVTTTRVSLNKGQAR
jgi:hypothetical protein